MTMTREEAINLIGWLKSKTNRDDDLEAIDMAIEALSERTGGAKPHGRLIDADALIESLTVDPIGCIGFPEPEWIDELIDILDTAPTVEVDGIKEK